jgi:hypothetical protein
MKKGEETGEDMDKIKKNLDTRFDWIWYDDLNGQVEEAKDKLKEIKGPENCELDTTAPSQLTVAEESSLEASYRPAVLRNESLSKLEHMAVPVVRV